MIRRRLGLGAAAIALVLPLGGCMTVHGERALIPSVAPDEAAKVLAGFATVDNEATKAWDPQLLARIETGPLGAIDGAGVRAKHVNNPGGNPKFSPLTFSDTKYWIPRQVGWPKFFVADTATNHAAAGSRWLMVFRRDAASEPWRAAYLAVAAEGTLPRLATDGDGHVVPVPADGGGLLLAPGTLGTAYTGYLQHGTGADRFAKGAATSTLRANRGDQARTPNSVTQYADQPADDGDFAPVALRTQDGGALVFFGTRHQAKSTYRAGYNLSIDPDTRALMTGTPRTSVTLSHVGQQMVTVPKAGATGPGGQVVFISRLVGLVGAAGE
ncbi:hypothetical protein [Actinacidiphila rubida]|uniref:DUF8094 domain-containing protein n=1 Tax=Actinacidiphila rubida TaxID=310780 RepID=A0A1H8N6Y6_9ACTN|nr:hypothetical protein [Actinacidiphila rubida]SEO25258.1 hypothetical protein SAMN05216267_102140 [Actinacidiphila rubida]